MNGLFVGSPFDVGLDAEADDAGKKDGSTEAVEARVGKKGLHCTTETRFAVVLVASSEVRVAKYARRSWLQNAHKGHTVLPSPVFPGLRADLSKMHPAIGYDGERLGMCVPLLSDTLSAGSKSVAVPDSERRVATRTQKCWTGMHL